MKVPSFFDFQIFFSNQSQHEEKVISRRYMCNGACVKDSFFIPRWPSVSNSADFDAESATNLSKLLFVNWGKNLSKFY